MLKRWSGVCGRPEFHAMGRINDTWMVGDDFVLQRLNRTVFAQPDAVMRNLAKALAHNDRLLVAPVATVAGDPFAVDAAGDMWRLFPRIAARNLQTLPDALLEPAASAFGGLLKRFAGFSDALEPVIDGFHDLDGYLARLDAAPAGVHEERAQVERLRTTFGKSRAGRFIHGDCKVNNLLFHPSRDEVVGIIDLDTIMVGDPAWDFGDLVRSVFAGAEETTPVRAPSSRGFKCLARGFVSAFGPVDDVARFAAAPAYMSFMLAVRFLTDHLQGDVYFKASAHGDNLARARGQLDLARRFLDARALLAGVLERVHRPGAG